MLSANNATFVQQPPKKAIKLTQKQQLIYDALIKLNRTAGAYELLDLLRDHGVRAPTIVYRALKALEEKGLVQYVAQSKTFVAFPMDYQADAKQILLVCKDCQKVDVAWETELFAALTHKAKMHGFANDSTHIELSGLCQSCGEKDAHE